MASQIEALNAGKFRAENKVSLQKKQLVYLEQSLGSEYQFHTSYYLA